MALLIGMGVTLISAIAPAMKAARIQPLAAINGIDARQDDQRKWPTIVAALTVVGGAILLAAGFGDDLSFGLRMGYLLPGALMLFVGLAILSRFVARPVMAVLGQPVKFRPKPATHRLHRVGADDRFGTHRDRGNRWNLGQGRHPQPVQDRIQRRLLPAT